MRYREYVAECFRRAFSGKIKTAELWAGIITIVLAAIAFVWKPLGDVMSWLPAATFGFIFLFLVIFGLALAPFRIHKEQEEVCRRLQEKMDERKGRQRIADKLAELHQECVQLLMRRVESDDDYISWKEEMEDWYERAQTEIQCALSCSEKELFCTVSTTPVLMFTAQAFHVPHAQDLQFFDARLLQLRATIVDINNRLR